LSNIIEILKKLDNIPEPLRSLLTLFSVNFTSEVFNVKTLKQGLCLYTVATECITP